MADASWPPSWRAVKVFSFALAAFVVGGFLLGVSFILQAMGFLNSDLPAIIGLLFMIGGLLVASGLIET